MPPSLLAFLKACGSILHPKMLALLLLPLLLSLAVWVVIAFFAWSPLSNWVEVRMLNPASSVGKAYEWASGWGLSGVKQVLMIGIALLFIVPLAFVTSLIATAAISMPAVARFLGSRSYKDVAFDGSFSVATSLINSLSALAIFLVAYFASIPLWFFPLIGLVIPWLCWGWLTSRVMRVDSLLEHATAAERGHLVGEHRFQYFALGMMVTGLNFIPFMVLVTPVLSALAFGHYSLSALRALRASGFKSPVRVS